jgi:putative DNA primase/helicase
VLTIPEAATAWHTAGVSTIPILTNGTKRPAVSWAPYQATIPTLGEIDRWWGNGHEYGLAVICGAVSGNLEMTELEGRVALDSDLMLKIEQVSESLDARWLWNFLFTAYSEWTPSGGIHLVYRISDHPVPGNEKIARRPATTEELAENPADRWKVLAETRGEGGYVIVAPTSGLCHPSGESWSLLGQSTPGLVPSITWEERETLHQVLRLALDEQPVEPPAPSTAVARVPPLLPATSPEGAGSRPGDVWAEQMEWRDILEPAGWTFSHARGREEHWTRPGKSVRDGTSATTNYADSNLLKVFSSSTDLEQDATYTKFGALAALQFRGDFSDTAKWLSRQGFGTPHISPRAGNVELSPIEEADFYTLDDMGNGQRMRDSDSVVAAGFKVSEVHRWVEEENKPRYWDGTVWHYGKNQMLWEADEVTLRMRRSTDEAVMKEGNRARSKAKLDAMQKVCYSQRGMTVPASDFDPVSAYLNLGNGVYNLDTGDLHEHHPGFMLTKKLNANFDPQAQAPQWESFLARALPDAEMRDYVQRCLGYTLLGNPSERAMFVIYGPTGTGKSTFLETLNHVFGDYGETAPAGTFRQSRNTDDSAPTPALHGLKGKRFVTTSETSEGVQWNEELVKRYTGRDLMRSRGLYEAHQTWKSEASIWMATNHAPRFTSDDRAIWNRVKLVPFLTVFLGDGQVGGMEEVLIREADGILNWLLAGLAAYRQMGLAEPGQVAQAVKDLREESDSVIRFLDDKVAEGSLVLAETVTTTKQVLYTLYQDWCRRAGERAVGSRRFTQRLIDADRDVTQSEDRLSWIGVGRNLSSWLGS